MERKNHMEAQENDTQQPDELLDEEDAIRRRLVNRIAIAGVMIVALLGGLAIVDALYVPPPAPAPAQMAAIPSEEEAAKTEGKDAAKEDAKAETPEADKKVAGDTVKEEDKAPTTVAKVEAPEKPAPEATPSLGSKTSKPIKALTPPAETKPASMASALRPGSNAPIAAAKSEPAQAVAQRQAPRPAQAYAHNAPASKPLSQAPAAMESSRRYLVQMGVFNNVANAEELRAKLEAAGVPAQIEARVQVGPFGSKEEAESARVKIAALGLDPGILMATKK